MASGEESYQGTLDRSTRKTTETESQWMLQFLGFFFLVDPRPYSKGYCSTARGKKACNNILATDQPSIHRRKWISELNESRTRKKFQHQKNFNARSGKAAMQVDRFARSLACSICAQLRHGEENG